MNFYNQKILRFNIVRPADNQTGWEFWVCYDFDHFFEREGYLNYEIHEENLDVLIIDATLVHAKVADEKLLNLIAKSRSVLLIWALQSARSSGSMIIPNTWPARTYHLLHQNIDLQVSTLSPNIIPIFYDFVYHEYRSWWFRTPFKSSNYYGAATPYDDRFFRIANVHTSLRNKISICVGKTRPGSVRLNLKKLFSENSNWLCYISFKSYESINDAEESKNNHLIGMRDDPLNQYSFDPITFNFKHSALGVFSGITALPIDNNNVWSQSNLIHSYFYQNTYLSIYGESIENDGIYVTEKTYAPLINGHFILPFAAGGFINYMKNRGFVLPDFIDYSYDAIINKDQRLEAYLTEVTRLMNIPLDEWHKLYIKNIDMIHYNRQKIFMDPYTKLGII